MRNLLSVIGGHCGKMLLVAAFVAVVVAAWWLLPLGPAMTWTIADKVNAVAFSPDGQLLVTCADTYPPVDPPRLWSIAARKQLIQITNPHPGLLLDYNSGQLRQTLRISANNRWLGYKSQSEWLHVFDLQTGQQVFEVKSPGWPSGFAFAPVGDLLLCAAEKDGRQGILFWDLIRNDEIRFIPDQGPPFAISRDGQLLATSDPLHQSLSIWNVADGSLDVTLADIDKRSLVLFPDSRHLSIVSEQRWFYPEVQQLNGDNSFRVVTVDLQTRKRTDWNCPKYFYGVVPEKRSSGPLLLGATYAKKPYVPVPGSVELTFHLRLLQPLNGQECGHVAFGNLTSQESGCVTGSRAFPTQTKHYDFPNVCVSPNGDLLLRSFDEFRPPSHWALKLLPSWLTPWTSRSTLKWFDTVTGDEIASLYRNVSEPLFSPDGQTLVTQGDDRKSLYFWDVPPRKPLDWFLFGVAAVLMAVVLCTRIRQIQTRTTQRGAKATP